MRVSRLKISNFRSIKSLEISFEDVTRFIGGNGAGKSTILNSLDLFYEAGTPNINEDDFHNRDTQTEIEIALTFSDFNDPEKEEFASRINKNNEMTVARVFWYGGGKENGLYFGAAIRNPDFADIRGAANKTDARNLYGEIKDKYELPAVTKADDIEENLITWEDKNPDKCEMGRDDGRFFGFTNVATGKLQFSTSFVFVPALRDVAQDTQDGKGSVITQLLDLVVRSAIESRKEIKELQIEFDQRYKEALAPEKLPELGNLEEVLSETLKKFYENSKILMNWQEAEAITLPLPNADIKLDEDGFEAPVNRTGHGLQRALIFTLLQHLALATKAMPENIEEEEEEEDDDDMVEAASSAEEPGNSDELNQEHNLLPGLILAIEEPELFQHPTKQRHLSRVLEKLALGTLPGVASKTQVIFATHSPLFISMDKFDELRIVRRVKENEDRSKETHTSSGTLQDAANMLGDASEQPEGTFSGNILRPKMHIIDAIVAEGFFSKVSVIVEGPSDRAAIIAAAAVDNIDLEELEISIIPVQGKSKIDKVASAFRCLDIPTYAIWDNDRGMKDDARYNSVLQRLFGEQQDQIDPVVTRVNNTYACFEDKIETTLKQEIGGELIDELLDTFKEQFEISGRNDAMKTPEIMKLVLNEANKRGHKSATLENIVNAIVNMAA
jgi:putative ATP-dependent endonuclease of the OLD family